MSCNAILLVIPILPLPSSTVEIGTNLVTFEKGGTPSHAFACRPILCVRGAGLVSRSSFLIRPSALPRRYGISYVRHCKIYCLVSASRGLCYQIPVSGVLNLHSSCQNRVHCNGAAKLSPAMIRATGAFQCLNWQFKASKSGHYHFYDLFFLLCQDAIDHG